MPTDQARIRSLYAGLNRTIIWFGLLVAAAWLFAIFSYYLSSTAGTDWFARSGSVMCLVGAAVTFRLAHFYQRALAAALKEGLVSVPREIELRLNPPKSYVVTFVSRLSDRHRRYRGLGLRRSDAPSGFSVNGSSHPTVNCRDSGRSRIGNMMGRSRGLNMATPDIRTERAISPATAPDTETAADTSPQPGKTAAEGASRVVSHSVHYLSPWSPPRSPPLSIYYLVRGQPLLVQGEVDATRFDIAARVDGRVGEVPVVRGQNVNAARCWCRSTIRRRSQSTSRRSPPRSSPTPNSRTSTPVRARRSLRRARRRSNGRRLAWCSRRKRTSASRQLAEHGNAPAGATRSGDR